jgi:hypothetical protein
MTVVCLCACVCMLSVCSPSASVQLHDRHGLHLP